MSRYPSRSDLSIKVADVLQNYEGREMNASKNQIVAFQGLAGAYSEQACKDAIPDAQTLPCETFDEAFREVENGKANYAMIPIDNTLAGRVADVHRLLPASNLHIIGEHYLPIRHALLGVKGAKLGDVKTVYSHIHAIPQCNDFISKYGFKKVVRADTAGAAKEVADLQDKSIAAIASSLAAGIYNLDILQENIQDASHNATRFIILSKVPNQIPLQQSGNLKVSFIFRVKNVPAALHKALGCFADRNVQMTKLESYVGANFQVAMFFTEIKGHVEQENVSRAFEALKDFTEDIRILGCYESKL